MKTYSEIVEMVEDAFAKKTVNEQPPQEQTGEEVEQEDDDEEVI